MRDRLSPTDCHAYVDNSLSADQRSEFELALRDDPQLRRRVDAWQAQNEAIRLAFGAPPRPRAAPALGRPVNENVGRAPPAETAPRPANATRGVERFAADPGRRRRPRARVATIALLAALFSGAGAWSGSNDPRDALMDAGRAAIRAFGAPASAPLDFASGNPQAIRSWLTPPFAAAPLRDLAGAVPGWRLIGARIVPGVASAAALILYENGARQRAGLMVEPLDAPPTLKALAREIGGAALAAKTEAGYGIAAMGPDLPTVQALMAPWRRPE